MTFYQYDYFDTISYFQKNIYLRFKHFIWQKMFYKIHKVAAQTNHPDQFGPANDQEATT